jgi:S1-C subfamily serine protease
MQTSALVRPRRRVDLESNTSYRPRVSRETRLLLMAGAAAIIVLWVLARVRFHDQPATPNPVPSVLGQLSGGAGYEMLASNIADVQSRLAASLLTVNLPHEVSDPAGAAERVAALRWRDDLAIALLPIGQRAEGGPALDVRALDPGTGLAVVRAPGDAPASLPVLWAGRRAQQPRYVATTDVASDHVALRPAFVGSFVSTDSTVWPGPVWVVPSGSPVVSGSFVFTTNGELVGLTVATGSGLAVVPGETLLAEAERLLTAPAPVGGTAGVEVQPLTAPIASLTGARSGVVVTWIDGDGPAARALTVGDVIESIDGRDVVNGRQWDVRMARLAAGDTVSLRVRRGGQVHDASIVATAIDRTTAAGSLGLGLRGRAGVGTEVTRVEPHTAGARAGLMEGDIITLFHETAVPTPAQITRAFRAMEPGGRVMVAVTRGDAHHVMTIGR